MSQMAEMRPRQYAIALDLGGTSLKTALVSSSGKTVLVKRIESKPYQGGKPVEELIHTGIEKVLSRIPSRVRNKVIGIGISIPGGVQNNQVIDCTLFPSIVGNDFAEQIREKYKVAVHLVNDVAAAAIAEKKMGNGKRQENMGMVMLGSGVGFVVLRGGQEIHDSTVIQPFRTDIINSVIATVFRGESPNLEKILWVRSKQAYGRRAVNIWKGAKRGIERPWNKLQALITTEDINHAIQTGDKAVEQAALIKIEKVVRDLSAAQMRHDIGKLIVGGGSAQPGFIGNEIIRRIREQKKAKASRSKLREPSVTGAGLRVFEMV